MFPKDFSSRTGFIFALVILVFFVCTCARSQQMLSFGWDPSPDTNVVGYLVEYGTESGVYTSQVDVGSSPQVTITNLQEGANYYFVVVAYETNYVQSPPSGELMVTMPGTISITPPINPGAPYTLSFPMAPGHWYEIQSATTIGAWQTLWQTPVSDDYEWAEFEDFMSMYEPQCFYRLVLH
ncbi:MAG TPA: fibronectin type III domain-containing protein [Verrucomicrobiae bacterium]|jgi:hypothetical protein|nr:fibronectin type III domain-containing protein [Verrucomicrobiae bacterium]